MKLVKGNKGERLAAQLEARIEDPISGFSTHVIGSDLERRMLVCIVSVHPPLDRLVPAQSAEYYMILVGRRMTIAPYFLGYKGRLPRKTFTVKSPKQVQEEVYLFAASCSPF